MRIGQLVIAFILAILPSLTALKAQDRAVELSDEEVAWLQSNPTLRVHNETNWPPFNFAANGQPQGYSIDFMNLVAEKVGLEIEYVTGPTWNEFLEMMKTDDLDVMLNIVRTPDRLKYLLYTPPYAKNPNAILSREDEFYASLEELFGKTVSVPKGFFYEEILKRDFPEIRLQTTDDTLGSMKAVSFGTADAAFGELAVFQYLMEENLITDLVVSGEVRLGDAEYALLNIATRRDLPVLASILTKAVNAVTVAEKRAIQAKWFPGADTRDRKQADDKGVEEGSNEPILIFLALSVGLLILLGLAVILIGKYRKDRDFSNFFGSQSFRISILAGLSILVAVVAVLNWLAITENKKHSEVKVGRELSIVLASTIDRLNAWIRDRRSLLRQVGRDPELVEITRALLGVGLDPVALARSEALREARRYYDSSSHFGGAGFFIISPDRINIGSRRDANVGTPNFIAEMRPDLIDRAFAGSTVFVPPIRSDVALSEGSDKRPLSMFFAAPMMDQDGELIAVVTERVLPDGALSEDLRAGRIGLSGETYAVNSDGNMVSESRFVDQLVEIGLLDENDTELVEIPIVDPGRDLTQTIQSNSSVSDGPPTLMMAGALAMRGETDEANAVGDLSVASNVDGYRDYRGVPVVGVWTWLPRLDLGLTVEMDHAEAFSDFANFRFNLLAISGVTTLLAIGATLFTLLVGQRAHRSLSKARDELEDRVIERTRELHKNRALLDGVVENSELPIYAKDLEGRYILVNRPWEEMTKVPREKALENNDYAFFSKASAEEFRRNDATVLANGETLTTEELVETAEGARVYLSSKFPLRGDGNKVTGICGISTDIHDRKLAEQQLADAYDIISSSINYAASIQRSVLPDEEMFASQFSDHFILWEPRDVVGGDIYWCRKWGDGLLLAVGDCTGHGVPGAFMTLIATGALDNSLSAVGPGEVGALIKSMHQIIQQTLGQSAGTSESDDGMEIGICYVQPSANRMIFAGARFDLFIVADGELTIIKSERKGIGYRGIAFDQSYDEHLIAISPQTSYYLATDGIIDQVGETKKRTLGKKRFGEVLLNLNSRPMADQKTKIMEHFLAYQGAEIRRDDVTVIGFKIT